MPLRPRLSNEEIKARLILTVGIGLTVVFVGSILFILYGLLFVTQPRYMSEADSEAWGTLNPMLLSMSGALLALLSSNGLKNAAKDKDKEPPETPAP
jgi:hypothetical protein